MKIELDTKDKPNLTKLMKDDPNRFKKFLSTMLWASEKLAGMESHIDLLLDTAEEIKIEPAELLAGIINGCLNEQFVNENLSPILGKELLPVALLNLQVTDVGGEPVYFNWRKWYKLNHKKVDANTIASAIGNIMKYARFLSFEKLSEALETNQLIIFKALPMEQAKLLPYQPALKYQKETFGEFHTGKFFNEPKAGFFDCGEAEPDETECHACGRKDLSKTRNKKFLYCRACNAGYRIKGADNNDDNS